MATPRTLNFIEASDNKVSFTVNTGKSIHSRKFGPNGVFTKLGCTYQYDAENNCINLIDSGSVTESAIKTAPLSPLKRQRIEPVQSEFSINQRFEFLDKFTNMVLDGITASAIVCGEGGLGKSHTVMNAVKVKGLEEDHDYVVIKGFATPKALYVTLWENKEKTIIFDDCDSVLKDPTAINLLKGALDSYEKRTISWLQRGFADEDIPQSFEFKGQVIFISNINSARLDGAIKSRSIVVDLSMTMKDKIDRMRHILPKILPDHSMKIKEMALDFMEEHAEEAKEFNLRTLMKASKVIKAYGIENEEWKAAVKYLLVSV